MKIVNTRLISIFGISDRVKFVYYFKAFLCMLPLLLPIH